MFLLRLKEINGGCETNQALGIFRDFDFPAKTNLFLLWTLLLYIP